MLKLYSFWMISKNLLERILGYKFFYKHTIEKEIKVPGNSYNHYCPNSILFILRYKTSTILKLLNLNLKIQISISKIG